MNPFFKSKQFMIQEIHKNDVTAIGERGSTILRGRYISFFTRTRDEGMGPKNIQT